VSHNGIDIEALEGTTFIASAPGIVSHVLDSHDNWGPVKDVLVRYNYEYTVVYTFEPLKDIFVEERDEVNTGDPIGTLGSRTVPGALISQTVHYGIKKNEEWICPVPYFNPEVRKKLNKIRQDTLIKYNMEHILRESPNLCLCPEHQYLFEP